MLAKWSKETCIATLNRESSRAVSLNGSRTGTHLSARQRYLGITGQTSRNGSPKGRQSPVHGPTLIPQNNGFQPNAGLTFSLQDNADFQFKRTSTYYSGSPTPLSSSDQNPPLRVDDLKRVLAGTSLAHQVRGASPLRNSVSRKDFIDPSDRKSVSTGSESAVSVDTFDSESERGMHHSAGRIAPNTIASINHTYKHGDQAMPSKPPGSHRPFSMPGRTQSQHETDANRPPTRGTVRPSSSSSSAAEDPAANAKALRGDIVNPVPSTPGEMADEDVPPVPPLPASVALRKNVAVGPGLGGSGPDAVRVAERGVAARGVEPKQGREKRRVDVSALLGSIDDNVAGGGGLGIGPGKPPY